MHETQQMKQLMSTYTPLVSQTTGMAALTGPMDAVDEYLRIYTRRRTIVLETLDQLNFTYNEPHKTFYVFLNTSSINIPTTNLSLKLLEKTRVLIFPNTNFKKT